MEAGNAQKSRSDGIYRYAKDDPLKTSDKDYFVRTTEYALYPNKKQERKMLHSLDVCRKVYNQLYKVCGFLLKRGAGLPGFMYLAKIAGGIWKHNPWMQDIYENCLNDVAKRVHRAFDTFLEGRRAGRKVGYPRFKSSNRYDSFTYPHMNGYGFVTKEEKKGGSDRLRLGKIGNIRFGNRFKIPGTMKTATVSRKRIGDHYQWKVCITWRIRKFTEHQMIMDPPKDSMAPVGIDLGLRNMVALSDGTMIPNDNTYRKQEKKITHIQRRISDAMGSDPNYRRTVEFKRMDARLAHLFKRSKNRRKDLFHKITRDIAYDHGDVYAEDISTSRMIGNSDSRIQRKLYRDAAWSTFMNMLSYKLEENGTTLHLVNPAYTTQLCSGCGESVPKDLSVRVHGCPHCGLKLDRDVNAARNIVQRGLGAARHVRDQRRSASGC